MTVPSAAPEATRDKESALERGLGPVIEAMLNEAEQRATLILGDADAQASGSLEDARRRGDELLAAARADGATTARRVATRIISEARRHAREEVLGVQRQIYERVRSLAQAQLDGLVNSPATKELNSRLGELARDYLDPDAKVETSETGVGVIATKDQRRLDLSSSALLERELRSVGPRIEELWS